VRGLYPPLFQQTMNGLLCRRFFLNTLVCPSCLKCRRFQNLLSFLHHSSQPGHGSSAHQSPTSQALSPYHLNLPTGNEPSQVPRPTKIISNLQPRKTPIQSATEKNNPGTCPKSWSATSAEADQEHTWTADAQESTITSAQTEAANATHGHKKREH